MTGAHTRRTGLATALALLWSGCAEKTELLLEDGFGQLRPGMFSTGVVGAHTEYHYLPSSAPQGSWAVSSFRSDGSQRAWRVVEEEDGYRVRFDLPGLSRDDVEVLFKDGVLTVHLPKSEEKQNKEKEKKIAVR